MRCTMNIAGSWWARVSVVAALSFAVQVFASDRPGAGNDAAAPIAQRAPSEVASVVSGVRLLGRGTMRYFGLSVYEARLWAGADFAAERFSAHAFALELQYARRLDGAAIAQRSIVEMRRAGSLDDEQARVWEAAMARAFPDVAPGDRLTGLHVPGETTRFFHNGRPTSSVADPAFARSFFGIWLAATTSEPGLRRQLIGPAS